MVTHKTKNFYKVIAVVGPTASGKSGLAIELAKEFHGEIINADSRQVYKYMDIGTAKDPDDNPNDEFYTVEGIRHHLIDFLEPTEKYSVADFQKLAKEKIIEISKRGKLPILVGGTGLWIDSVCKGNYQFEKTEPNWELRKALEQKSVEKLFTQLKDLNSIKSKSLNESDRKNPVRLIRLIEKETVKATLITGDQGRLNNSINKGFQSPPDKGRRLPSSEGEISQSDRGEGEVRYIPYQKSLTNKAKTLRKNPTKAEKLFWFEILKKQFPQYKFHRQKPLLNYIVDFYCSELMIAIEIDGDVHAFQENYDKKRTKDLEEKGITVIRYENDYVLNADVKDIATDLIEKINKLNITPSNSPLSGGINVDALYLSPKVEFEQLEEKIYTRVDKMIKQGLIEEVKGLLKKGYNFNLPSMSGIGYKEFDGFFTTPMTRGEQGGLNKKTLEDVKNEIKLHTRQYAKRQVTWFKRNKDINYVDLGEARELVKSLIVQKLSNPS